MRKLTGDGESASSREPQDWHAIDWRRVEQFVRTTQRRIAKATLEKDWRKVKALQRSLNHSFSARALAVRRVTENQGKRTAGVDRQLWDSPALKRAAIGRLKQQRGYRAKPLRRVYIPKSNGKERPLGIPTMLDRAMQALHLLGLEPVAETTSDPNSYGFRRNRSTADAMGQIFVCTSRKASAQWVLEADIEGCFDHINHEWLVRHVPMNKTILRKWLKAGVVHQGRLSPTEEGTPQGGIISPTLANMALNGLEGGLIEHLGARFGRSKIKGLKVNVIRYADDFVVTGSSRELLESEIRPWIEAFLAQRGLRLSLEKTKVVYMDEGFDFLGWNFRKYKGKLLIKPSKKNVKAFYSKVRGILKTHISVKQEDLIAKLNPVLRGWAQYHQPVVAKEAFSRMDSLIYWRLMRWSRRRHPNKSRSWCKSRYWQRIKERDEFAATVRAEGGSRTWKLLKLADTEIVRHEKIKGEYNPFDPAWEVYGEKLRTKRMLKSMSYQYETSMLFIKQDGRCALCAEPLDYEGGWHDHHIVRKVDGGSDVMSNRVLLHPVCHTRLHALGLTVTKPA
ncbi:group II intron reverse transcriptase/maturase [Comamonas kerstersii]|uniref:group II intron reverse transcriptase/maturase n=1 Tax=Comamonas kerstersii TaxID=225992 RepID=UPI000986D6DF|nr:group II intron reverse transcriptase/maturase [Comamonas kerstersii]OOH88001.1 group II intron reverse transcriptase/maturase [Comamonas kerstersii]OOH95928.1 group II intron reverse transcriptase/maturase [Comamonas kerstersii]